MTTFWCSWCGTTVEDDDADVIVQCVRCITEFARLFRFWPEAGMIPLEEGEDPGNPGAAQKRFTFRDADGRIVGTTWAPQDDGDTTGSIRRARTGGAP